MNLQALLNEIHTLVVLGYSETNFPRVKDLIEQAISLDPEDPVALAYYGAILAFEKHPDAITILRKANLKFNEKIDAEKNDKFKQMFRIRRCHATQALFAFHEKLNMYADEETVKIARFLVDDVGIACEKAYVYLAEDCYFNAEDENCLRYADKALAENSECNRAYYYKASLFAALKSKAEMLQNLKSYIDVTKSAFVMDVRPELKTDKNFADYLSDDDFLNLVSTLPSDPVLNKIYKAHQNDQDDQVIEWGLEQADQHLDPLAILQIMRDSATRVSNDIEEHGELNISFYKYPLSFYENIRSELTEKINSLKNKGLRSTVYSTYKG